MPANGEQALTGPSLRLLFLGLLWFVLATGIVVAQVIKPPTIEISWQTETEFNTAGFNIYRSSKSDSGFVRLNEKLIAGSANAASGSEYLFVDRDVDRGATYYYQLEEVEVDNSTTVYDVISGRAEPIARLSLAIAAVCLIVGSAFLYGAYRSVRG